MIGEKIMELIVIHEQQKINISFGCLNFEQSTIGKKKKERKIKVLYN
jgi:cell division protein FtsL